MHDSGSYGCNLVEISQIAYARYSIFNFVRCCVQALFIYVDHIHNCAFERELL